MRAKAKVKISIDEVKEEVSKKNKNVNNKIYNTKQVKNTHISNISHTTNTSQSSSDELSPTNFLSVSKLKSSIQNIFY
jgi:hypothetical protein